MLCLKLIFQVEVGVFGWTVVVGSVDRLKICHHMKAVENKYINKKYLPLFHDFFLFQSWQTN
jgi:hypothetical protein